MVATKSMQELIKDENRTGEIKDLLERSRDQYGMQSFDQHLTELYQAGEIALDVAKGAASNPSDFERALNFSDDGPGFDSDDEDELEKPSFVGDEEKPEAKEEEEVLLGEVVEQEGELELA